MPPRRAIYYTDGSVTMELTMSPRPRAIQGDPKLLDLIKVYLDDVRCDEKVIRLVSQSVYPMSLNE